MYAIGRHTEYKIWAGSVEEGILYIEEKVDQKKEKTFCLSYVLCWMEEWEVVLIFLFNVHSPGLTGTNDVHTILDWMEKN